MPLLPLTAADCRLIPDRPEVRGVIDTFNRRAKAIELISEGCPELLEDPLIVAAVADLANVRDRLTRKRYQVGFIGPFQIGKSSTFNNLAGVAPDDSPSPEGGVGAATSSTITRVSGTSERNHTLSLTYLTTAQYQAKREALCLATGFDDPTLSDEQILRELPRRIEMLHAGQATDAVGMSDYEFLGKFLRSYRDYGGQLIRAEAIPVPQPYAGRAQFLMHDRNAQQSENMLLRQAEIQLAGSLLPLELEMIDLPGLGSQGTIDTILTEGFLNELDGALVFAKAEQIGNAETQKGFSKLAKIFEGRLAARLWLVITQFDSMNRNSFHGDERGDTIFHTIKRLIDQFRLSPDRVFLVSNPIYRLASTNTNGKPDPVAMRGKLEKNPGDLGPDWVPSTLRGFPELCRSYEDGLLVDGGIGRLRRLVGGELAVAVGQEISDWAKGKLATLHTSVTAAIERAIRRQGMDPTGIQKVSLCLTKLLQVQNDVMTKAAPFEVASLQMREQLTKEFAAHCPDAATLESLPQPSLARLFNVNAQTLETCLQHLTEDLLIPEAFKWVGKHIANLPPIPVAGAAGVQDAWQRAESADAVSTGWRAGVRFPTFLAADLFDPSVVNDPNAVFSLTGTTYQSLMEEKIWLTVHAAVHAVRNRMAEHTKALKSELDHLVDDHGRPGAGATVAKLQAIKTEVGKLT